MSERILSFDIIRGWAILGNLMVHSFMLMAEVQGIAESNPADLDVLGYILMGMIVFFGHWRGLFLLISAAVHMYSMQRKLKNGIPRHIILFQELLKGLILWLWAMFFYVFLAQWGPSKQWVETGSVTIEWQRIYHADQFANIAWAIMISAVIFYILSANDKLKKPIVGAITFAVVGLLFIFPAPYALEAANNFWGLNFADEFEHYASIGDIGWWDYILRLFSNQFIARESPLMPHFGYSAVGSILGIFMSQEKPDKKKFLGWGFGSAGFCLAFGIFWLFVVNGIPEDPFSLVTFHIHPTWFMFIDIGLLLILVLSIFAGLEFNRKANLQRRMKISRFSRRVGFLSLTVYSLASLQSLIRMSFWGIFQLFGWTDPGFRVGLGLPTGWVFLLMAIEIGIWSFILWIWEKGRYIGSLDWFFAIILKGPANRKKADRKSIFGDFIDVQNKLIDPTPVHWVEPIETEISKDSDIETSEIPG